MSHHRFVLLGMVGLSLCAVPGFAPAQAASQTGETITVPVAYRSATIRLKASTDIQHVAQILGAAMNRIILVDPRIKGTLNLTPAKGDPASGDAPEEVEYRLPEAWRVFTATLRGLGYNVVDTGSLLKVVPEAEAKLHAGVVQIGAPQARGDQVVTQIFRLNHENPNNLMSVLRPLITPNNTINVSPTSNTIVITDYADNVQRLARIIAELDQPAASDIEVVPVRHAMASDLAPLVQKLLGLSNSSPTGGGGGNAANQVVATTVLADPRNNSLIVRSANPVRLNEAKVLIDKLDRAAPGGGPAGNIWVVYLKNAEAVKLAEVLRAALAGGASATGNGTSGLSGLSGVSNSGNRVANVANVPGRGDPSGGGNSVANTPVSASAGPSTGGQIQADPSTNSLIISAPEPVYRQIRQVIDQLDTRRAQVRVESIIVKVDASKSAEFGVQWQTLLGKSSGSTGVYTGTNFGSGGNNLLNLTAAAGGATSSGTSSTSSGVSLPGSGLNVGVLQKVLGTWTLGALARFLETNVGGNVLSTPEIVALDNEEAKIVVGQNVPFITGSYTSTGTGTGATNPFQTIERKDVGLTLRIKSQVGEGGTVRMTIYQENSSVSQSTTSGLITDKSSIETSVLVDDGSTLVLGGLMKDEYTDDSSSVPLLAQIPLIGNLFRSTTRSHTKSNLMVFLRPTVIRDQLASDRITLNRYDAIRATQSTVQPNGQDWLLPIDGVPPLPSLAAPSTLPVGPKSPATATPVTPAAPASAAQ